MTYPFSDARIGHLRLKPRQFEGLFLRLIILDTRCVYVNDNEDDNLLLILARTSKTKFLGYTSGGLQVCNNPGQLSICLLSIMKLLGKGKNKSVQTLLFRIRNAQLLTDSIKLPHKVLNKTTHLLRTHTNTRIIRNGRLLFLLFQLSAMQYPFGQFVHKSTLFLRV